MKLAASILHKVTALAVVVSLTGCAAASTQIGAAYVSPLKYQDYSCEQLGRELSEVDKKVEQASSLDGSDFVTDAVALLVTPMVLWPVLFLVNDRSNDQELAQLNGEHQALAQCAAAKQCTVLVEAEKQRLEDKVQKIAKQQREVVARAENGES